MDLQELYGRLALPPEIAAQLERIGAALDLGSLDGCLEGMLHRGTAKQAHGQLKAALGEDPECIKMLYCQLECARRAWDRYRERGIPESIYWDTMGCFPRFLAECRRKTGRIFFDRDRWTWRQTGMALFRIGALEYELLDRGGTVEVHIPSDADFSREAVDSSLARADGFFRRFYPEYPYDAYTCHSWLLSPALPPLLPDRSHIRSFQERFTILGVDGADLEFMEWLFQAPAEAAWEELPARTRLQRAVRELLRGGGTVGSAYGRMERRSVSGGSDAEKRTERSEEC